MSSRISAVRHAQDAARRLFVMPLVVSSLIPAGCGVAQTGDESQRTGGPAVLAPTEFASSPTTADERTGEQDGRGTIGFPEFPSLSPDGRWLVFNWAGDLWVMRCGVEGAGSGATRLTAHPAEERRCAFSPDGGLLAFESDREGARNIYVMPVRAEGESFQGGVPVRLTTSDRPEGLGGFSADGKFVYFAGERAPSIHTAPKMYKVEILRSGEELAGGVVTTLTGAFGASPRAYGKVDSGTGVLFGRNRAGLERPKYRGSGTQDVWLMRSAGSATGDAGRGETFVQVTANAANDAEGFARPDGSVVFISSRDGQNNLWMVAPKGAEFDDAGAVQLTKFAPTRGQYTLAHGVRDLAVSADGRVAVFAVWDRLYRLDLTDRDAKPVAMDVRAASAADAGFMDRERRNLDKDVSEAVLSPDGKTLAVVARGEVFVRNTQEGYPTRRVTMTAGRERDLSWSPDGEYLYFSSDVARDSDYLKGVAVRDLRPSEGGANGIFRAKVSLSREDLTPKPAAPKKAEAKAEEKPEKPAEPKGTDPKPATPVEPKVDEPAVPGAPAQATPAIEPAASAGEPKVDAKKGEDGKDGEKKGTKKEEEGPDFGKRWAEGLRFEVEPVVLIAGDARTPLVSPDGKRLMYVRGLGDVVVRELPVVAAMGNAGGTEPDATKGAATDGAEARELVIVESVLGPDVQWTADSRHVLATISDLDYNNDVWIVDTVPAVRADAPAEGAQANKDAKETEAKPEEKQDRTGWEKLTTGVWGVNLTRHPDNDGSARLSADGKVLVFLSERGGQDDEQDVWAVYLDKDLEGKTAYEVDEYFKKAAEAAGKRKPLAAVKEGAKGRSDGVTKGEGKDDAKDGEKIEGEKKEGAKKPEPVKPFRFDAGDAYLRVRRMTTMAGSEGNLEMTPGGDRIIFSASVDGERSLFSVDQKGKDRKALMAGDVRDVRVSLTGEKVSFIKAGVANTTPKVGGKLETLGIEAQVVIDVAAQQRQKFLEAARLLGTGFYHPTLKGLDWPVLTMRYAGLAEKTRTSASFNRVTQMLFGELDGSHTGISGGERYTAPGGAVNTGYLGVRVEPVSGGYRVTDVTMGSPADEPPTRIHVGETIVAVDGVRFSVAPGKLPEVDFQGAFAGKAGKEVLVEVLGAAGSDAQGVKEDGGKPEGGKADEAKEESTDVEKPKSDGAKPGTRLVLVVPVGYMTWDALDYQAEVLRRRGVVDRLSNGKLGYLHIRSMGEESVREFERDLFAAASGKEGLIIDVRDNGGGYTADILLASLTAPNHAYTAPRGVDPAKVRKDQYPRDRRLIYGWTRPINVLINQNSFSNAEIFAHAIKTIGRGKLVGTATFGGVISTGASTLVDGTNVRTPFRGWYLPDGSDQENNGAKPDVPVAQTPADEAAGVDAQLRAAVEELMGRVGGESRK